MSMFSKDPDPVLGLFDGFDPKSLYQMVPEQDTRRGIKITTAAEPVEVSFEPENIARFGARSFMPPTNTPVQDYFMVLGPRTLAKFDLFGQREGQTLLTIKNGKGVALESLIVSVKKPLRKTYSLCLVHDMRRRSPWLPPNDPTQPSPPPPDSVVRPMMEAVRKVFLQQANVILAQAGAKTFDVTINDRNLGDPIVLDSIAKPENQSVSSLIVARSPSGVFGADFIIYLTWDIREKRSDFVGLNVGKICFVEYNSLNPRENGLTTAHELGHALGLAHNGRDLLMAGDGVSRSSLLQQFEIDTVNRSGTVP